MNSFLTQYFLSHIHDTYYIIDVETFTIVETNDAAYVSPALCYTFIHNFEKPCFECNIACPIIEAQKNIHDSRRICDENGKLTHVILFLKRDESELKKDYIHDVSWHTLIETNKKYRTLFNNYFSAFLLFEVVCDNKGKAVDYTFLEANPAFERLIGITAENSVGKQFLKTFPNIESYWITTFEQISLQTKTTVFENFAEHLGKYFEIYAYQLKHGQFAVIFNDITQRKRAVRALAESENRLRAIIEHAPGAIYLLNNKAKIIKVNKRAVVETGYSYDELVHMFVSDIDVGFAQQDNFSKLWLQVTDERVFFAESVHKRKDGSLYPVELRAGAINIHGERHIIAFAHNISEHLATLKKLETHNELLESLQRISHYTFSTNKKFFDFLLKEAIALSQSKIGYIFMYNEQTKIFTLSAWSKEVMPNCAVQNPQTQYKLDDTGLWGEAVRQRKPIIENNYCAKKSSLSKGTPDKHVELQTYATIPIFVDNKIVAVIGVANKSQNYTETEVTQLQVLTDRAWKILEKQELFASLVIAKEKAEESNALKTKFLSNISHEIRTPMNAILGFSDMLDIENITAEERTHYVSIVKQSGQQLMKVINDIIEISKIQAQTIVPEKQVCTIFSIVKNAIEIVQQQQYLKLKTHISIEISDSIKQADISIISDQVYLQKTFTNLISNAIKYTKDGWVKIGAYEPRNGFITFYVQDTGIGIPQEKHEEIFGFFNQLQNKTIVEGIGIGLSIIKGLVNVLGGSVWLDSEVNVGTTFYFSLPYIQAPQHTNSMGTVNTQVYNWSAYTIYIAENDEILCEYLDILLHDTGVHLKYAANGKQLITLLETAIPDIILLDINMPEMNGKEVIQWIRKQKISVPVIAQTAYSLPEDISSLLDIGCTDHIAKPIQKAELFEKIMKYLP